MGLRENILKKYFGDRADEVSEESRVIEGTEFNEYLNEATISLIKEFAGGDLRAFGILDNDRKSQLYNRDSLAKKLLSSCLVENKMEGLELVPELVKLKASRCKSGFLGTITPIGYCFRLVPERRFSSDPLYYAYVHRIGD